jgi:hypothetical protein
VNKWCRDLVEIKVFQNPDAYIANNVGVSHRTVRDFLLTQEMQKEFLEYPICRVSTAEGFCMAYLALSKIWPRDSDGTSSMAIAWARICAERESMTPFEILDDLLVTARTVAEQNHDFIDAPRSSRLDSIVLRRAAQQGLTVWVGKCLDRDRTCKNEIWEAIMSDHIPDELWLPHKLPIILATTNMLLAKGFDPNDVSDTITRDYNLHNNTIWQHFLQISRDTACPAVAKLLLLNGADPDVDTMGWDSGLYDVRQCLLAGYMSRWYKEEVLKFGVYNLEGFEREIDSWLAGARTRKAAKSLKALEDVKDQTGSIAASLGPRYPTSIIMFICVVILAIYTNSIFWFASAFGFRWRPDEA